MFTSREISPGRCGPHISGRSQPLVPYMPTSRLPRRRPCRRFQLRFGPPPNPTASSKEFCITGRSETLTPDLSKMVGWWLAVPESLQQKVISKCHSDGCRGHTGIIKTVWAIRKKYFFRKIWTAVTRYVSKCSACIRAKSFESAKDLPLGSMKASDGALSGGLHRSVRQERFWIQEKSML